MMVAKGKTEKGRKMALSDTYKVQVTRTESIEVIVTDATEQGVWDEIVCGWVDSDGLTRADYDELPDEEKVKFIAKRAIICGLDFVETTGEQLSIFDIVKE